MGGFISGIGVTIILMQAAKLFGGNAGTGEAIKLLIHIAGEMKSFNPLSAVLGVGTVVIILVAKKFIPKFPMSVLLMVLGALATAIFILTDSVLSFFHMLIRDCRDSHFLICQLCLRIRQI